MRCLAVAMGLLLWQSAASAQSSDIVAPSDDSAGAAKTGVIGGAGTTLKPEFTPLTTSERLRLYITSTFGPGAILRAAATSGINQWRNTPKEWRGGAEAYGERFGSSFATHVIRKTLESGGAALLHEDNRYMPSNESGFFRRTRHAVMSVFIARNDAGAEHFAYSRFGGALGGSFISRIWQPRSNDSSGDAAVNFGITIAADMGWNMVKEFRPHRSPRL